MSKTDKQLKRSSGEEAMDDDEYDGDTLCISIKSCLRNSVRCDQGCRPSGKIGKRVMGYFPVWKHLRSYKWRKCLVNDVIAGLSVGVVHVPQGMGFALMAGLPPVYGLYSSLFPGWLYYIFGTSRHLSLGTMALIALMVGAVVGREDVAQYGIEHEIIGKQVNWLNDTITAPVTTSRVGINATNATDYSTHDARVEYRVGVAMSLTLMVGICQLIMRVLRLGVLTNYMSSPFVDGFMCGSGVNIVISQIPFLFGLHIHRPSGSYFQVPRILYAVVTHLPGVNFCSLAASVVAVTTILAIKHFNERFKTRMRAPFPAELLVVIVGTMVSYLGGLEEICALPVIGPVPLGLPAATVPPFHDWQNYLTDAILIAVVGFAIGLTMGKLMATKHKYEIDSNQELLSYGIINTIGPFFGTFAATQAPPRTLVASSSGGKTQLTGFISTLLPLCVCLFLGPLFHSLPISILGSIVFCALLPLVGRITEAPPLWRINRFDFITWLTTFCFTVFVAVTVGLVAGILISVFLIVVQAQLVEGSASVCLQAIISPQNGKLGKSTAKWQMKDDAVINYNSAGSIDYSGASVSPSTLRNRSQQHQSQTVVSLEQKNYEAEAKNENENFSRSQNKYIEERNNDEINNGVHGICIDVEKFNGTVKNVSKTQLNQKEINPEAPGIVLVFKFDANLFFANSERFKTELYRCTVDPAKLRKARKRSGCSGPACWNLSKLRRQSHKAEISLQNLRGQLKKQDSRDAVCLPEISYEAGAKVEIISVRELDTGKEHGVLESKERFKCALDHKITNNKNEMASYTQNDTGTKNGVQIPYSISINSQDNYNDINEKNESKKSSNSSISFSTTVAQPDGGVTPEQLSTDKQCQVLEDPTSNRYKPECRLFMTSVSELLLPNQVNFEVSRNENYAQYSLSQISDHGNVRDTRFSFIGNRSSSSDEDGREQCDIKVVNNDHGITQARCSTNVEEDCADSSSPTKIRVDCLKINYVDVTGLNSFRQARDELAEAGVKLKLMNFNKELARKARLVGLQDML